MAKKKIGRPATSDRIDGVARIDRLILNRAQTVAKERNVSVAEYLSELLKVPVERDFLKVIKRLENPETTPPQD